MNAAQVERTPGLWASVVKLLRLRLRIWWSGIKRATVRRKIGLGFLAAVILAGLGLLVYISWSLLNFLQSPRFAEFVGDQSVFIDSLPVLLVGGAFLGVLLTSFGVLLQALYLANDMDFLLAAPIPIRAVFVAKLLQAILPNLALISLISLPLLVGLGLARGYNPLYYLLVIIIILALALAAAGLGALLVMGIVRIFPARRVAEVLGFVGAISSFLCSQSGQLARFEDVPPDQAMQVLANFSRFASPWSPLSWPGQALVSLGRGQWLVGSGFLVLTLALCGLFFYSSLAVAERLYYSGWANMQNNRRKKKSAAATAAQQAQAQRPATTGLLPQPLRAIIIKDFYMLRRELRNMSQLITPLIFGLVYAVMLLRDDDPLPVAGSETPALLAETMQNIPLYISVALAMFVSWMLVSRLAGMGFSQEGKNYWLLKAAPLNPTQLLTAKFLVAFLPSVILGWIYLLIISLLQPGGLGQLWFTLLVVALTTAANTGINLAFGVAGANMTWEDPRRMTTGLNGCLSALVSFIFLPLCLGFFFGPAIIITLVDVPAFLGQLGGLLLGGIVCVAAAVLPPWLVRSRVLVLDEPVG